MPRFKERGGVRQLGWLVSSELYVEWTPDDLAVGKFAIIR